MKRLASSLTTWILVAVLTLILASVMRSVVVETFRIPSESMRPTLIPGDYILVAKWERLRPFFRPFERGDVVVFHEKEGHFIKRIVALPGDTVEMQDFVAIVNGRAVDTPNRIRRSHDPVTVIEQKGRWGPQVVPEGTVFVLGDNRLNSEDSRFIGPVPEQNLEGRAVLIYWSRGDAGVRWSRIMDVVP